MKLLQIKNVCNILIDLFYLESEVIKMCNYCDLTKSNWEILFRNYNIKSEYGIAEIYFNNSELFVSDTHANEVSVKINYCPMCGKKL